jgi:hypothetical protein
VNLRSEETKRNRVYIVAVPHGEDVVNVAVTIGASCQKPGSSRIVDKVYERLATILDAEIRGLESGK